MNVLEWVLLEDWHPQVEKSDKDVIKRVMDAKYGPGNYTRSYLSEI